MKHEVIYFVMQFPDGSFFMRSSDWQSAFKTPCQERCSTLSLWEAEQYLEKDLDYVRKLFFKPGHFTEHCTIVRVTQTTTYTLETHYDPQA